MRCQTIKCVKFSFFTIFFQSWLKTYGYLLPSDTRMSALHSGKVMQSAVSTMQQFYGIPITGVLDQTTIE